LQLHFDHAGLDIGAYEYQVAAIGLHRWTHQVQQTSQGAQARGTFEVGEFTHHPSLPEKRLRVTP
jgi:hypothetical protein